MSTTRSGLRNQLTTTVYTDKSMLGPSVDVLDKYNGKKSKKRSSRLDPALRVAELPPSAENMATWSFGASSVPSVKSGSAKTDYTKYRNFPKLWRRVLDKAKIKNRYKMAVEKGFPLEEEGKEMSKSSLYASMHKHGGNGGRFEKGS